MRPQEFFALAFKKRLSIDFDEAAGHYWEVECAISCEEDINFTWLPNSTEFDRECRLCGRLCHTTEYGSIPRNCDDKRCAELRDFWGVQGFPQFTHIHYRSPRTPYLKARMSKVFGIDRISQIPFALRFDFLLATMIERIAHEAQH